MIKIRSMGEELPAVEEDPSLAQLALATERTVASLRNSRLQTEEAPA